MSAVAVCEETGGCTKRSLRQALALGNAGLGDEGGDGLAWLNSGVGQGLLGLNEVFRGEEYLRLEVMGRVAKGCDDRKIVGYPAYRAVKG